MIGQTLGSYSIQRELGRGGMGAVYVGYHALLGRPAAIKVLLPQYSQNQEIVQRFFNEARAATAIRHPGIVEVYDFGFATDGAAYIVMELCDGESLAARIRRLRIVPTATALGFARQIAGALAAAHKAGIVHRDLKPDNVFLVPDAEVAGGERIKLLDFGIAKLAGDGAGGQGMMARTSTGALMGTPYYMSPEQCRGAGHVDHRSDLYALGCILFEMVCGQVPFVGEGVGDIIGAHLHVAPPQPRAFAPDLPPAAEALILGLLAKKADQRIATADAVVTEIRRMLGGETSGGYPIAAPQPQPPAPAPMAMAATVATMAGAPVSPTGPPPPTTLGAAAAQVASSPPRRASKAPWIAGGLLVAAGAVAAIVIASGSHGDKDSGSGSASASAAVAAAPPDARVLEDPPPLAAGPPPDAAPTTMTGALLAACWQLRDSQKWTELADCAAQLAQREPGLRDAASLAELAKKELAASIQLDDLRSLLSNSNYPSAKLACDKFPADSASTAGATELCDKAKAGYIAQVTSRARALAVASKCKDIAKLGQEAGRLWPEAKAAIDAVQCTDGGAPASSGDGSAAPPPAKPQVIAPSALTLVAGTRTIEPDAVTIEEIQGSGKSRVIASYKLCFDMSGGLSSVSRLKSSEFDAYDAKLEVELRRWKIKPYMVNGAAVAVCTAETFVYKVPPAASASSGDGSAAAPAPSGDCAQQVADAKDAALSGQYARSLHLCEQAISCDTTGSAVTTCAIAACNLRNAAKAKKYILQLSGSRQTMVRQTCLRNGVDVEVSSH